MFLDHILNSRKNILITGGSGFIGGALIRKLLKESKANIFNIDKLGYASNNRPIENLLNSDEELYHRYHFFKLDIKDKLKLKKVVSECNPDLIMHLAAESHVDKSIINPQNFIDSNIVGTFNLLEAAKNHYQNIEKSRQSKFRFHHISTDEVFGSTNSKEGFSEKSPYMPQSPYSASKAASDHLVRAWQNTYNLPIVITNCSNNFGPWQFHEKLIPLTIFNALNNKEIPLYGDGLNIRDWIYIEDHVQALILAANKGEIGSSYCIGSRNERTNKEVVETICKMLDKKKKIKSSYSNLIKFVKDRPGHDKRYAINPEKIMRELNWSPKFSFEEGMEKTVSWYLENINLLKDVTNNSI